MTEVRGRFETDVLGIWGLWPSTPARWSHTSLAEIEACPSRWMLSRAAYPDLWDREGYPPLPVVAAIFGNVVHAVVDRLAKKLGAAGITSPSPGDVVGVLSSLGGWRGIVLDAIEGELLKLSDNPRITLDRITRVRDELVRRAPDAADQVKVFLGRGVFPSGSGSSNDKDVSVGRGDVSRRRAPAGRGAHAEQELTAEKLRLTGRIDLLVVDDAAVTITDLKTGMQNAAHEDQVRLYALLWYLDSQVNPARRLATELRVAHPGMVHSFAAPGLSDLEALADAVATRVEAADRITREPPPTANPNEENCQYCYVKHLCDAYWSALPPAITEVSTDDWFDFEGRILRRNGSKSWFAETLTQPTAEVLVRTVETNAAFQVGKRVRLLGVRRSQDPDDPARIVISLVPTSEWYLPGS